MANTGAMGNPRYFIESANGEVQELRNGELVTICGHPLEILSGHQTITPWTTRYCRLAPGHEGTHIDGSGCAP